MFSSTVVNVSFDSKIEAEEAVRALGELRVLSKRSNLVEEDAPPPYTTFTMLEDAAHKLGWDSTRTMKAAQSLFEAGLITYPRTDSIHVSAESRERARDFVRFRYGANLLKERNSSRGKGEQEGAHEAIRPSDPWQLPQEQSLLPDTAALYAMIWERFIASEMPPALYRVIEVEMEGV
jgi:DNA topoisomerase-1